MGGSDQGRESCKQQTGREEMGRWVWMDYLSQLGSGFLLTSTPSHVSQFPLLSPGLCCARGRLSATAGSELGVGGEVLGHTRRKAFLTAGAGRFLKAPEEFQCLSQELFWK